MTKIIVIIIQKHWKGIQWNFVNLHIFVLCISIRTSLQLPLFSTRLVNMRSRRSPSSCLIFLSFQTSLTTPIIYDSFTTIYINIRQSDVYIFYLTYVQIRKMYYITEPIVDYSISATYFVTNRGFSN